MLGLRPSGDHSSSMSFHKSTKFAEKLAGRFFVSGISGGFSKHRKPEELLNEKEDTTQRVIKKNSVAGDIFMKRQEAAIQADAERLAALEEKLNEANYDFIFIILSLLWFFPTGFYL